MFNIFILIKNHILKILGPFGFQESGSLSFDHIIDFHDYITIYLIFIFVLVMWALFYSLNIILYPKFATFFVGCWYGAYVFTQTLTAVLLYAYNRFNLSSKYLYRKIITSRHFVQDMYRTTVENIQFFENEMENIFYKNLIFTKLVAAHYVFLTFLQVFKFIIGFIFFALKELFLMSFKQDLQPFFDRIGAIRLKVRKHKYVRRSKSLWPFIGLNKYRVLKTTKDVWTLFAVGLYNFTLIRALREFFIGFIFFRKRKMRIRLFKRKMYFVFRIIMQYSIIYTRIIMFFNNGSKKLNDKTLRTFYDNIKRFKNSKRNFIRFARRITHASNLEIVWTIFPSIILLLIAVPSLILLYELDAVAPVSLGVKIIGRQWYWSYSIGSSFPIFKDLITLNLPEFSNWDSYMVADETSHLRLLEVDNPLFLPAGIPITLFITASDVIHSWAVPALGIKVDAIPGRLNQVSFTIYATGILYGQCSELCGVNHGFMPIQIVSLVDNSHLIH